MVGSICRKHAKDKNLNLDKKKDKDKSVCCYFLVSKVKDKLKTL